MLDTIFETKAQVRREIGTNSVGVEYDRIEQRSDRGGECRLAAPGIPMMRILRRTRSPVSGSFLARIPALAIVVEISV
jgi:hypothetical protein